MKKTICLVLSILLGIAPLMTGCSTQKETIIIYTSIEDYVIEDMSACLEAQFPEYDIIIEYMNTGNHAAKLLAEGTATACDISYDLEYAYLIKLANENILADLSDYDQKIFCKDTVESNNFVITGRNGGAVIINNDVLAKKGLPKPTCYEDLLKNEYKGLISMPNPKSSGTGYMFLKSLVNAWGEDEAFAYFEKLTPNILQYTSSGSGPVNALLQGEAAIGLGMTAQAVTQINEGAPLEILYFEEGSPFSLYGQAIIEGKQERACVQEVFDYLVYTYSHELNRKFFPEQIFTDTVYEIKNYPTNIVYADMSNNSIEEKEQLLERWAY